MARREYLSLEERTRFDTPPVLTIHQRPILVDLPTWAETYLQQMQTPTNKVGFLLQLGYFRVTTRFFVPDRFEPEIIEWVSRQLRVDPNAVEIDSYANSRTAYRHREDILKHLSYVVFGAEHRLVLAEEAQRLAHLQTRPTLILDALAGYLREHRVEIPPYNALRAILTDALDAYQARLEELIETSLRPADRALLDSLLQKQSPVQTVGARNRATPMDLTRIHYRLTALKRISQSMQPKYIRERVELFTLLKTIFTQLAPLIVQLNLSDETIRFYAQYVLDTQSKQSAQRQNERYLRLIAFLVHQYLSVGDALILTLRQAVTALLNESEQVLKDELYESRQTTAGLVGQVVRRSDTHIDALSQIETIIDDGGLGDSRKVEQIRQLFHQKRLNHQQLTTDKQQLQQLKTVNQPLTDRDDYYNAMEKVSVRLQARVSGIVQVLVFDDSSPIQEGWVADMLAALQDYQARKGDISMGYTPPLAFLDMDERQRVFTETGKLRVSLYKVLLFRKLRDGLRNGSINVLSSYDYRAFEEYMLPRSAWLTHRQMYLTKANLIAFARPAPALLALNKRLND